MMLLQTCRNGDQHRGHTKLRVIWGDGKREVDDSFEHLRHLWNSLAQYLPRVNAGKESDLLARNGSQS
jgi:hypothetical protein